MNKKLVFIADFFVDQVLGGGELNSDELIKLLKEKGFDVEAVKSHTVELSFLKSRLNSFFIVSNFMGLSQECKNWLIENAHYIIYEHDHKYLPARNPAQYDNFRAPQRDIRNFSFYKNAFKVVCQTQFHKNILMDNLKLKNIVSFGGNLWSEGALQKIRELSQREKQKRCSIMDSPISHKNTTKARKYCSFHGLSYDLIADANYFLFLEKMSKNETLVFFPGTPETLSRLVCEARMMGMSVKTNGLVGAVKEEWFSKKGEALIDYMMSKRKKIVNEITSYASAPYDSIVMPKVSILSTYHDGSKFLEGFLDNIVEQTMFKECELILVDANSQGNEQELVQAYQQQYKNIKYLRLDKPLKPTPCINIAIKESAGEYLALALIDDRKSQTNIEELYSEIRRTPQVDLVYGDTAVSKKPNELFHENDHTELAEHSKNGFSRENMIKCLPGPMPLWRRDAHDRYGFFDEDECDYADDWEMWLRMVNGGAIFRKLDKIVGLYLNGGRSQQETREQRKEEARIFFKYSDVYGYNFVKYAPYFRQFV